MHNYKFQPSVKLETREIALLLNRLGRQANTGPGDRARRRDGRLSHPITSVPAAVHIRGDTYYTCRTPLLDLSASGAGLVFGRFVHPEAEMKIALTDLSDAVQVIPGMAAWCRLHKGVIHRVGMRFHTPIDITQFAADIPDWCRDETGQDNTSVSDLEGIVSDLNENIDEDVAKAISNDEAEANDEPTEEAA